MTVFFGFLGFCLRFFGFFGFFKARAVIMHAVSKLPGLMESTFQRVAIATLAPRHHRQALWRPEPHHNRSDETTNKQSNLKNGYRNASFQSFTITYQYCTVICICTHIFIHSEISLHTCSFTHLLIYSFTSLIYSFKKSSLCYPILRKLILHR